VSHERLNVAAIRTVGICAVLFSGCCALPHAADVRVIESAMRVYRGKLSFIESGIQLDSACVKRGMVVMRGAPFSADTIRKMQFRAGEMGADTLLIRDTTIGPVSAAYVIRMVAYRCLRDRTHPSPDSGL